ncbi:MAG: PilZ domain-containing protein [Deltaproteobacteria bacterium]|nr:MAG: PilZ domain-containing protein [Deltaproteobacteria bacterium]
MQLKVEQHNLQKDIVYSVGTQAKSEISWQIEDRRNHIRLSHQLLVQLSKVGLYSPIGGMTENVSQDGAFIKTKDWHLFQLYDQVVVTFLLPPSFSGQHRTLGLQGTAVVVRLVEENEGVAVHFIRLLKQFERMDESQEACG